MSTMPYDGYLNSVNWLHSDEEVLDKIKKIRQNRKSWEFFFENLGNLHVFTQKLQMHVLSKAFRKLKSSGAVLTAVGGAYQREDGVFVAPINLLKP